MSKLISATPLRLDSTEDFSQIIHVADIHIELLSRHDEYSKVFAQFYDQIKTTDKNSIVFVLGDLFHVKSDL